MAKRRIPDELAIVTDQNIRHPIAIDVDHPKVGILPPKVRHLVERREWRPLAPFRPLVVTGQGIGQLHQSFAARAGYVQKALACVTQSRRGRPGWKRFGCPEAPLPEVALVEPAAGLLGEKTRDPFFVEVEPPIGRAVCPDRQIRLAVRVDVVDDAVKSGASVSEVDGG